MTDRYADFITAIRDRAKLLRAAAEATEREAALHVEVHASGRTVLDLTPEEQRRHAIAMEDAREALREDGYACSRAESCIHAHIREVSR